MPIERFVVMQDVPKRQSAEPTYDSRDAYVVDLHLNEGCPNNGPLILEGTQLTAIDLVCVKPKSASLPSVK